jgi:hypothetical protein
MIETYAFLVMFTIQILAGSVLGPALFIKRVRARVASFPAERFAELFPGVDKNLSGQRFATRYRALNTGVGVLGLVLLGWLFMHMRRPEWNQGRVPGLLSVYSFLQLAPLLLLAWKAARSIKALKSLLADGKRKALLKRRGLFDFVSPLLVVLAALNYFLFVAFVLYIRRHPFPGFGGLTNILIITLVYALGAFVVFGSLYGRKRNPLETHADRLYTIGVVVKTFVYTCIAVTVFASLELTLSLLHLQRWGLFAVSVFFVICVFFSSLGAIPRRPANQDELGCAGPLPPGTGDLSA